MNCRVTKTVLHDDHGGLSKAKQRYLLGNVRIETTKKGNEKKV